jgi:hypothetical protein
VRSLSFVLVMVTGCSLTMSTPPANPVAGADPRCSDSVIPPAFDTTVTVASGIVFVPSFIYAVRPGCGLDGDQSTCNSVIRVAALVSAASGVAFGLAANRGFETRSDCRRAYAAQEGYVAEHPAPPGKPPAAPAQSSNRYTLLLFAGVIVGTILIAAAAKSASDGFHL